jgi:hypothetical protein
MACFLSIALEDSGPVSAALAGSKVGEVIEKIAMVRAALADRSLSDLGPATVLEFAAVDPAWRASADIALKGPGADSVALSFCHFSYGWLCFVLPDKQANALGQWLVANTAAE